MKERARPSVLVQAEMDSGRSPLARLVADYALFQLPDSPSSVHNGGKHGFQAPDQEFHSTAAGSFARNSLAVVTSGRLGSAFFQSVKNC